MLVQNPGLISIYQIASMWIEGLMKTAGTLGRRQFSNLLGSDSKLRICVVGSGPAGFYTAEKLLKRFEKATVDIVERLPTPFGLVRSGVAPDHPETKIVIRQFSRVATSERCSFFGNVTLGKDITLQELRQLYSVVVLAYGAESDRALNIPGENLRGIHSAREFVWWYNGHPDGARLSPDLKSTDTSVILGQGNVALDAARILLRPTSDLAATDIADHALNALQESNIRHVYLVGRRGPVQAACTAKELREILGIKDLEVNVQEVDLTTSAMDLAEMKATRSHKRVYELFCKAATTKAASGKQKRLDFIFFRAPHKLIPGEDGQHVAGVSLEKTILAKRQGGGQEAVGIGEFEELKAGLVLKSIGYKSVPVAGVAFDQKRGVVSNIMGRVLTDQHHGSSTERGLYVVGWLKRGPTGIIGTNLNCAEETIEAIVEDERNGLLESSRGRECLQRVLEEKGTPTISFEDWLKIDEKEKELGRVKGKSREKVVDQEEMLKIAGKFRATGGDLNMVG